MKLSGSITQRRRILAIVTHLHGIAVEACGAMPSGRIQRTFASILFGAAIRLATVHDDLLRDAARDHAMRAHAADPTASWN